MATSSFLCGENGTEIYSYASPFANYERPLIWINGLKKSYSESSLLLTFRIEIPPSAFLAMLGGGRTKLFLDLS